MIKTFKLLFDTMLNEDMLITAFAAGTLLAFVLLWFRVQTIKKDIQKIRDKKDYLYSKRLWGWTSRLYTLFTTMITIFPLLGMLGTVSGLLGLDLATGDMENIKNNFFIALTSTAWGIVWSVMYKVVHAFSSDYMENYINIIKEVYDELAKSR